MAMYQIYYRVRQFLFKKEWVIFLFLFILSASLRLYNFEDRIEWITEDMTRDVFVAEHSVKYQEYPVIGHTASGNEAIYPTHYYYLLSLIALIHPTSWFMTMVVILWTATTPLWIYMLGKRLFNREAGIVSAFLFAINPVMISKAELWSIYIGLPFFTIGTYLVFDKDMLTRCFGYAVIVFSSIINASGFVGLFLVYGIDMLVKRKSFKQAVIMGFCIGGMVVYYFLPMLAGGGVGVLTHWFNVPRVVEVVSFSFLVQYTGLLLYQWFTLLFPMQGAIGIGIGIVTFSITLAGVLMGKKRPVFITLMIAIGLFFLFGATKKGEVELWYFTYIYPFFFLFVGSVIVFSYTQRYLVLKICSIVCLIFFIVPTCIYFPRPNASFPKKSVRAFVSTLIDQAKKDGVSSNDLLITGRWADDADRTNTFLSGYAVIFEEMTGKKMAESGFEQDGVRTRFYVYALPRASGYQRVYYVCVGLEAHPTRCIGDVYRKIYVFEKEIESSDDRIRIFQFKRGDI